MPKQRKKRSREKPSITSAKIFKNDVIVITGTLAEYTRKEAEKLIKSLGGKVSGTLSKKVTKLVIADSKPGESKISKAQQLGIPSLTESQFLLLISGEPEEEVLSEEEEEELNVIHHWHSQNQQGSDNNNSPPKSQTETFSVIGNLPTSIQNLIESRGHTFVNSIDKNVTKLIIADSSKLAKATHLNIPTITESQVLNLVLSGNFTSKSSIQKGKSTKVPIPEPEPESESDDENQSSPTSKPLANEIIVVTGTLADYNRKQAEKLINSLGGKVSGSISKKVTKLVIADLKPGASKISKAEQLGIPCLTESEFMSLISAGNPTTTQPQTRNAWYFQPLVRNTDNASTAGKSKFGGQPDWIEDPTWPVGEDDEPVPFIGQFCIENMFPNTPAKMAYFFQDGEVQNSFEFGSLASQVILQPGCRSPDNWRPIATGPTELDAELLLPLKKMQEDPPKSDSDSDYDEDYELTMHEKIGGYPKFVQGPEFPGGSDNSEGWINLFQFNSLQQDEENPDDYLECNFGDVGTGYAFLSKDGSEAKFMWQCG